MPTVFTITNGGVGLHHILFSVSTIFLPFHMSRVEDYNQSRTIFSPSNHLLMTSFSQNIFLRHKKSNHMACVILNMNCTQLCEGRVKFDIQYIIKQNVTKYLHKDTLLIQNVQNLTNYLFLYLFLIFTYQKKEVLIFDFLILFICTILIIVIYLPYRSYLQHEKLFSLFKERGGVVVASRYTRSRLLLLGFLVSKFWQ